MAEETSSLATAGLVAGATALVTAFLTGGFGWFKEFLSARSANKQQLSQESFTVYREVVTQLNAQVDNLTKQVAELWAGELKCREISAAQAARIQNLEQQVLSMRGQREGVLVDAAGDAILSCDQRGNIVAWNGPATRVSGYLPSEVIGRSVTMLMDDATAKLFPSLLDNFFRTGQSAIAGVGKDVKMRKKTGELIDIHLTIGESRGHAIEPIYTAVLRPTQS